jgi:hypothetical protein
LLLAWETLLPLCGRFPVTWQILDMAVWSLDFSKGLPAGGGQRARLYTSPERLFQGAVVELLGAHKLSGVVAHDLSGSDGPSNWGDGDETGKVATGDPEDAI